MPQSMYSRLVSQFLFPIHEWVKGHTTTSVLRHLEQTQWWRPEQLQRLQAARLRTLLGNACSRVPHYRRMAAELALDFNDIASVTDLRSLPFLTKEVIRAHEEDLKAAGARRLNRFNTGGSSGEPLIFYIGDERVSHDIAAKWRATRWWGVDIGDPEVVVWGSPIELHAQDRIRSLRDRIFRSTLLPAFEMSPKRLDSFIEAIRRRRPKMLFGYPSALALISRHAELRRRPMDDLGLQVAFVTSEALYDDQKEQIERVFGCPVANGYGGRDSGFIAHQCPEGGMHITAEDIIVEIIGPHGEALPPGKAGEVVVTHLATRDFPFIRYKTGDVAVLDDSACPCGRGLPLLKEVRGRTTDFVTASDGTVMHGLALIYVMRDIPGIEAFKIVQEDLTHTRVLLVAGDSFDTEYIDTIANAFKERLGQDVQVVVEQVPQIPPERSGKYRYVVSKVSV